MASEDPAGSSSEPNGRRQGRSFALTDRTATPGSSVSNSSTPATSAPRVAAKRKASSQVVKNNTKKARTTRETRRKEDDSDNSETENAEADQDREANQTVGRGLDLTLPPIQNVEEAFIDMVKRRSTDLQQLVNEDHVHLRVATMCSGTESPVFALHLIRESFSRLHSGEKLYNFEHVFSVENQPFKQAYIARNTEGSIVFRDVRDFADPNVSKAPTAMGGLQTIPKGIDLLIAGTSCVDFSSLNNRKREIKDLFDRGKTLVKALKEGKLQQKSPKLWEEADAFISELTRTSLDDAAESALTFFSMLKYVQHARPKVVILENVQGAPWDSMRDIWFFWAGYVAGCVTLDSKDYYIPQTRTRGYLIAVDRQHFQEDAAYDIVDEWQRLMTAADNKRRASTPVSSWLLPPTHPLTIRACQDDAERGLSRKERDVGWVRSMVRYVRARRVEMLGNAQPLTRWSEIGDEKPYDRFNRLVLASLPDRAKDCIDMWFLRGITKGMREGGQFYTYDMRHKTKIHDLSQNIDRSADTTPFGISPCVTPKGMFLVTNECRLLSGYEALAMQGLPILRLDLAQESQFNLRDLAGNAMTTTVVGNAILNAFISIFRSHDGRQHFGYAQTASDASSRDSLVLRSARETAVTLQRTEEVSMLKANPPTSETLRELVRRCRRYCYCNGATKYSTDDFQQCGICGVIRCRHCAGNPQHAYQQFIRPALPVPIETVPVAIMRYFPSIIPNLVSDRFASLFDAAEEKTLALCPEILQQLSCTVFYYKDVSVTEAITISYEGKEEDNTFEVRATLCGGKVAWYLYVRPSMHSREQVLSPLQLKASEIDLDRPVARAIVNDTAQQLVPAESAWELRTFARRIVKLNVSPLSGNDGVNIEIANYQILNQRPRGAKDSLLAIEGNYKYQPTCDAAEDSLHSHEDGHLFLFKSPQLTGLAQNDSYVISDNPRMLEAKEYREVRVKFPGGTWDARNIVDTSVHATVECYWLQAKTTIYRQEPPSTTPATNFMESYLRLIHYDNVLGHRDNRITLAEIQMNRHSHGDKHMIISKYEHAAQAGVEWATVGRLDQPALYEFLSPINIKVAGSNLLEHRFHFESDIEIWSHFHVPIPPIVWIRIENKLPIPHRDYESMTLFESKLKERSLPFQIQIKVLERDDTYSPIASDMKAVGIRYTVNPRVLMCQALSHLPGMENTLRTATSRLDVKTTMLSGPNPVPSSGQKFKPFRESLKPLRDRSDIFDAVDTPRSFSAVLSADQMQSLAWMVHREKADKHSFTEREQEELIVPELDLRLVGCAKRVVHRPGGILADDVGYGKTVVCLALIAHQRKFDQNNYIDRWSAWFRARNDGKEYKRYPLLASLVIVPDHLVDQWAVEAQKFLRIEQRGILTIKRLADLRDRDALIFYKLRVAKVVIVSSGLFNDKEYHFALAKFTGSLDPPTYDIESPARVRAFEEWYRNAIKHAPSFLPTCFESATEDGKGAENLVESIQTREKAEMQAYKRSLDDIRNPDTRRGKKFGIGDDGKSIRPEEEPKTKKICETDLLTDFPFLLEGFSFDRVIYDEFSYKDILATLFFKETKASVRWILSATPPTRNLRDVCTTAELLRVHVARPMAWRAGLPGVTEGPAVQFETTFDQQMSCNQIQSDRSVVERQEQAHRFLQTFASSNPIDEEFRNATLEEVVVVCNMSIQETTQYVDLQKVFKDCNFDLKDLPKEFRHLLPKGMEPGSCNTKALVAQALIIRASTKSESLDIQELKNIHTSDLATARRNLKLLADKAVWLAGRLLSTDKKLDPTSTDSAKDIAALFLELLSQDYSLCDGVEGWKAAFAAVFPNHESVEDFQSSVEKTDLPAWVSRAQQKQSKDAELTAFLKIWPCLYEGRSTTWADYFQLDNIMDSEELSEIEMRDLVEDYGRMHQVPQRETLAETIEAIVSEELLKQAASKASRTQSRANASSGIDLKGKSRAELQLLCLERGIALKSTMTLKMLKEMIENHEKGELGDDKYSKSALTVTKEDYPLREAKVRARGSNRLCTDNAAGEVAIELTNTITLVARLLKQLKVNERLSEPASTWQCDRCQASGADLYLVLDCGHVLCKQHVDRATCSETTESLCPSRLKGRVIPLASVYDRKRALDIVGQNNESPSDDTTESDSSTSSQEFNDESLSDDTTESDSSTSSQESNDSDSVGSKTQCIIETIKRIPDNDYIVLFYQFELQRSEIVSALRQNHIEFSETVEQDLPTNTSKLEAAIATFVDRMSRLPKTSLAGAAVDFHLPTIQEDAFLEDSHAGAEQEPSGNHVAAEADIPKSKSTRSKVLLLKLDSSHSAGLNLQYANHVMFASTLCVELQETWDALMHQAIGRCLRYGQKKPVKVYHFVTAHTFEVDLLELRKRSHILVAEGQAVGRFHPVPADTDAHGEAPSPHNSLQAADDDVPMNDSTPAVDAKEFDDLYDVSDDEDIRQRVRRKRIAMGKRSAVQSSASDDDVPMGDSQQVGDSGELMRVTSALSQADIWILTNEAKWLTTVGILS